jgi:hypothetical protein
MFGAQEASCRRNLLPSSSRYPSNLKMEVSCTREMLHIADVTSRFEVPSAVTTKSSIFLDIKSCKVVSVLN